MVENDYERFQRRRNIIVGAFILIATIALFWMVFKMGDMPLFVSQMKSYEVRVQFPSAPGIQKNPNRCDLFAVKILLNLLCGFLSNFNHNILILLQVLSSGNLAGFTLNFNKW